MFTDTAGEDNSICTADEYIVGTDVFHDPADEHLESKLGAFIAVCSGVFDVAHIAASDTGNSIKTGLLVEKGIHFFSGCPQLYEAENCGRIHVTASGTHHQTFQGGESHGGVDDFTVFHSRHTAAVAQVTGDDGHIFFLFAQEFGGGVGHEVMACAVETVFTDAVFGVVVIRNGIQIGFRGHGLMEFCIEYSHIGNAFEDLFTRFDTHEVGGVVERSEGEAFTDDIFYILVNENRFGDLFAAVENTVTDGGDFGKAFEDANFRIYKFIADCTESVTVVCHFGHFFHFETVGAFEHQIGFVCADSFHETAGDYFFICPFHGKECEFEGGTSGVENKYFHFFFFLSDFEKYIIQYSTLFLKIKTAFAYFFIIFSFFIYFPCFFSGKSPVSCKKVFLCYIIDDRMYYNLVSGNEKVKNIEISSSLEDYLEAIACIVEANGHAHTKDIAQKLNVKMPSVSNALQVLAAKGLIKYHSHAPVVLTAAGTERAAVIRRRHGALKTFFVDILKLTDEEADLVACRVEHTVGEKVMSRFVALTEGVMNRPESASLREYLDRIMPEIGLDAAEEELFPLSSLEEGESCVVVKVSSELRGLKKFADLGLVTGTLLTMEGRAPFGDLLRVRIMGTSLMLRECDAALIFVRKSLHSDF